MLTHPSRATQNLFHDNKSCESSITTLYLLEISECICYYLPVTECPLWALSLLHIRTANGVIFWYILDLQRLFHFIACVAFLSISLFLKFFLWSLLLVGFPLKVLNVLSYCFSPKILILYFSCSFWPFCPNCPPTNRPCLVSSDLLRYWSKFVNTCNKAVELFLGS